MADKVDVDAVSAEAFGLADDLPPFQTEWHTHRRHQLLYAAQGTIHLEVGSRQWSLPPQRAALIPAGVSHRARADGPVVLRTVYLSSPVPTGAADESCRVLPVTALAREMILHAMRWGPDRDPHDATANAFFVALAALAAEWAHSARPVALPVAVSSELDRAMRYTLENLGDRPTSSGAARVAGVSPRTLARRFADEAHTSWGRFVHDARLLHAMELLAVRGARVTDTAYAVGFSSLGAFCNAFKAFTGESPKEYRRRATDGGRVLRAAHHEPGRSRGLVARRR